MGSDRSRAQFAPPAPRQTIRRSRALVLGLLALTVLLGLGSRSGAGWLPQLLARNAGDALWTCAVYLTLALCAPAAGAARLFLAAISISFAVELSQLWRPAWLEELRATVPGRLLLGQGWVWMDLARYAVGAGALYLLDRLVLLRAERTA